uniref:Complement C1q-like protein 4 n=1 Tax=Magallana gigas TaxID=29159 RepID=K1RYH6_MAGGI
MSKNVAINTISKYKTIVYDSVETNNGKAYDARSGKFTAPESGLYVFHTSTTALDKSHSIIEIAKNGQVKDVSWADAMDHNDRAVASTMSILNLTKGDVVLVRVGVHYMAEMFWRVISTQE